MQMYSCFHRHTQGCKHTGPEQATEVPKGGRKSESYVYPGRHASEPTHPLMSPTQLIRTYLVAEPLGLLNTLVLASQSLLTKALHRRNGVSCSREGLLSTEGLESESWHPDLSQWQEPVALLQCGTRTLT